MNTPAYDDIAKLIGILIHMREPFDSHGPRVAGFAVRLATAMGMSSDEVQMIGVGAHLHDIGKLLIRQDLLNAPRRLNDAERAEMQTHTQLGWRIVTQAGYSRTIQNIVLSHQEKWNGNGYPNGLLGDAISKEAQIVGICDVFEALTNTRPYRDAFSPEFAQSFIKSRKKTDFNPELVDLFCEHVVNAQETP